MRAVNLHTCLLPCETRAQKFALLRGMGARDVEVISGSCARFAVVGWIHKIALMRERRRRRRRTHTHELC